MGSSRSIKNAELIASTQNSQLNNWTIPSIAFKAIYKIGMFNFISQDNIKTAEQDISQIGRASCRERVCQYV